MRPSLAHLAIVVTLLPACGARTQLDDVAPTDLAPTEAMDASRDVTVDVATGVAADALIEGAIDASDGSIDAPGDASPEADASDAGLLVCAWDGFAVGVTYPEGPPSASHPTYVAVGDFDRDGHLDFVATDAGQTASVFLNHGDGTFAPQVTYPSGAWTNTVVTGDFDGDGWLDVAAANGLPGCGRACCQSTCDATVAVLINHGDGTFEPAAFYDSGGRFAAGLAAGDMNGDHQLDFVLTNYNSGTIAVMLGHGDGTFGSATTYAATYPDTIVVADLDGNGALDVIVGSRSLYPSSIATFFNDGTGALTAGATYDYGASQSQGYYSASSIVVGEFDGSHHLDVVVSDTAFGDVIRYSNSGNGVLANPMTFGTLGRPGALVAADFDGDGQLDVATSTYVIATDGGAGESLALVLLGDGHGAFSAPITSADVFPFGITAGDLDGDGHPDVVTGNSSSVSVFLSQCAGDADAGDAASDAP